MRSYIQKNLQSKIRAGTQKLHAQFREKYDAAMLKASSVGGSLNNRDNARNCFIFGDVELQGSGKLLNCFVMPGVTLRIGDNAIVTDCMFMSPTPNQQVTVVIGKNAAVTNTLFCADSIIGAGAIIIDSVLGYAVDTPIEPMSIRLGDETILYHSVIKREVLGGQAPNAGIEFRCGSRSLLWKTYLRVGNNSVCFGDDCCLAQYIPALKQCLSDFTLVIAPDGQTPVKSVDDFNSSHSRPIPATCFTMAASFGDRCYIGVPVVFQERKRGRAENRFIAGDDVNIVPGTITYRDRNAYSDKLLAIINTDIVHLRESSTLSVAVPLTSDRVSLHEVQVDAGSVLVLDDNYTELTRAYKLHVTKRRAIRIA